MCCGAATAQPLDEVSLEFQSQGVVATIHLTGPVQYQSHFPESHGKTLEIYYDRVKDATSNETWVDNEVRKSPPSRLIPGFTVTTRDQSTKPKVVIEFAREAEFSVAAGKDNRSLLITIRPDRQPVSDVPLPFLPTIKPEAKPVAAVTLKPEEAAAAEINKQARALMVQGRDALAARKNDDAVDALNKLLLLPPNDYTQDGQEWIGVARERAGDPDKAKVEYDLYLRLFPEGTGATRVAQRLEGLSGLDRNGKPMAVLAEKKQAPTMMTFGSVSSRYYFGHSKLNATSTFNGATTTDSLSFTDQSMLITSVDASERYRTNNYDSRLVFRDTDTKNFLSNQPSQNRVNAAYGEIKGRTLNYLLRVGRQSPMGGGVLGRFDGLAGSYGDAQNIRVNAVAGSLQDYSQGSKPKFFGASVDRGAFSFYGINQTLEGIQDRRAVGTEFRYFDDKKNAFGLLDYDTYFKKVNAAQFMTMFKGLSALPNNATVNFMVDHRKTPSLSIRNALNGATTSSVNDLLQATSASALRELALARTATANMGQIGITVPYRDKWQVGGDLRLTNTSGLPTSGTPIPTTGPTPGTPSIDGYVAANPGPGLQKSVTGQVIGSGLNKQGDIWSGSITLTSGSQANGHSFFFFNHTQVNSLWTTDVTFSWSGYKDQFGGKTTQIMPMLRGSYRYSDRFTFDADCGYQNAEYSGPQMTSKTQRLFMSGGMRWDF
jgi:tetratricopeptide (TPR) repeat protein